MTRNYVIVEFVPLQRAIRGSEYKEKYLHRICAADWPANAIVQMITTLKVKLEPVISRSADVCFIAYDCASSYSLLPYPCWSVLVSVSRRHHLPLSPAPLHHLPLSPAPSITFPVSPHPPPSLLLSPSIRTCQ